MGNIHHGLVSHGNRTCSLNMGTNHPLQFCALHYQVKLIYTCLSKYSHQYLYRTKCLSLNSTNFVREIILTQSNVYILMKLSEVRYMQLCFTLKAVPCIISEILQMNMNGSTPESIFHNVKNEGISVKSFHTLFCSVYVLDSRLQSAGVPGLPK